MKWRAIQKRTLTPFDAYDHSMATEQERHWGPGRPAWSRVLFKGLPLGGGSRGAGAPAREWLEVPRTEGRGLWCSGHAPERAGVSPHPPAAGCSGAGSRRASAAPAAAEAGGRRALWAASGRKGRGDRGVDLAAPPREAQGGAPAPEAHRGLLQPETGVEGDPGAGLGAYHGAARASSGGGGAGAGGGGRGKPRRVWFWRQPRPGGGATGREAVGVTDLGPEGAQRPLAAGVGRNLLPSWRCWRDG